MSVETKTPSSDVTMKKGEKKKEMKAKTTNSNGTGTEEKKRRLSDDIVSYTVNPEFLHLLVGMKADMLLEGFPEHRLYITHRDHLVTDVFKGLIHHNFLSVPVLQKRGKYVGFLDLGDIVQYVVQHFGRTKLTKSEDFWKLVQEEEIFQKKTVDRVMMSPVSVRNPFHPVKRGYSLFSVFEILAREHNVHRVPIVDEDRMLLSIVTESQAIKFLKKNLNLLGGIKDLPVGKMRGVTKEVISVSINDEAIVAFQKMIDHKVYGVAVLDEKGMLIENISMRDLKAIAADCACFWRLYQTVRSFLERVKDENKSKKKVRPDHVITCEETDTLEMVINKLADNNIHRVYIVEDKKPIGVVALRDVIFQIIDIAL